jgi:hypothetical protein
MYPRLSPLFPSFSILYILRWGRETGSRMRRRLFPPTSRWSSSAGSLLPALGRGKRVYREILALCILMWRSTESKSRSNFQDLLWSLPSVIDRQHFDGDMAPDPTFYFEADPDQKRWNKRWYYLNKKFLFQKLYIVLYPLRFCLIYPLFHI